MLLINAVRGGRLAQVKMFIKVGIDVDQFDENGQTGLIHTCFLQESRIRLKFVKALVFAGANVNKKDFLGRNVLSWACLKGRSEVVKFLLNDSLCFDLEVHITDHHGNNALLLSVVSGNFDIVRMMIGVLKGSTTASKLNKSNNSGMQPLTVAIMRRDKLCAQFLIKEIGASLATAFKYFKDLQNNSIEFHTSASAFSLLEFSQDKEQIKENLVQFAQFTDKELFDFVFADAQGLPCDVGNSGSDQINHETKRTLLERDALPRRLVPYKEKPSIECSSGAIESTSEINVLGHFGQCTSRSLTPQEGNLPANELLNLKESYRTSVQQLMFLYAEQNSPSFRHGVPIRRYTLQGPQDFNTDPDYEFNARRLRSSLQPVNEMESDMDQQLRLKYGRNVRATSMQVPRLPTLSGMPARGKIKRTRSSVVMNVRP